MTGRSSDFQRSGDYRSVPVIVLGLLIATGLVFLFPAPGDGGPITFAVRLIQVIAAVVGVSIIAVGVYSYRSGNRRPAMVVGTATVGLLTVGIVGGLVEMTSGYLIPIWTWAVTATLVVLVSCTATNRLVREKNR